MAAQTVSGQAFPCRFPPLVMMRLEGPPHRPQVVTDPGQFLREIVSFMRFHRSGLPESRRVIGPTVLADMLIGFATPSSACPPTAPKATAKPSIPWPFKRPLTRGQAGNGTIVFNPGSLSDRLAVSEIWARICAWTKASKSTGCRIRPLTP